MAWTYMKNNTNGNQKLRRNLVSLKSLHLRKQTVRSASFPVGARWLNTWFEDVPHDNKRKRSASVESESVPGPSQGISLPPQDVDSSGDVVESRTARRKRRKRERAEAQAKQPPTAGDSQQENRWLETQPSGSTSATSSQMAKKAKSRSVKPIPAHHTDPPFLPPIPHELPYVPMEPMLQMAMPPMAPLPSIMDPVEFFHFAMADHMAQVATMGRQLPPHIPLPYPPPPLMNDAPHEPLHPPPPPPPPPSDMAVKRIIGMTPDTDPLNKHSTFISTHKKLPNPDPSRTLVMGMLPKKFRTPQFGKQWAHAFDRSYKPRIEVDLKRGKIMIEFRDAEIAQRAWASPRLRAGDGKEHIRVWWYRELEEGEIAEEEEPPPPPPTRVTRSQRANLPPKPPPLTLDTAVAGPSNAPHLPSNDDEAMDVVSASDDGYIPELLTRRPKAAALPSLTSLCAIPDSPPFKSQTLDPTAPAFAPHSKSRTDVVTVPVKSTPSPTTSHATTTAVSDLSFVPSNHETPTTTPSPTLSESTAKSSSLTLAKHALLARQKELEAKIAKSKEEIAARMAKEAKAVATPTPPSKDPSPPTVALPVSDPAVAQAEISVQPSVDPAETKPSAESELRLRALKSLRQVKKRTEQSATPTKPSPSPAPAKPAPLDFSDLAESFISETIQNAIPSMQPPSPTSYTPTVASHPPMKTQKAILAEKQQLLEQHIAESKVLMEKLTSAKTKPERDAIMRELRESTRKHEETMKKYEAMSSAAAAAESRRPSTSYFNSFHQSSSQNRSPWPETPSDAYILTISDAEDDDMEEDDDED
ncbi:hypothetical protein K474DRAFT_1660255 [Panus rudis PR-1116 ss-1]|nr:hypothetical protein K474DRAFT_1660255 [Panus rudis PR-1116 ss-1]